MDDANFGQFSPDSAEEDDLQRRGFDASPRWECSTPPSDLVLITTDQCPSTGATLLNNFPDPPSPLTEADFFAMLEAFEFQARELPGGATVAPEAHESDPLPDRFQNEVLRLLPLLKSLGKITFLPPILRPSFLPSAELDLLKDLMVAGSALGHLCIKLAARDGSPEILVVCTTTAEISVLPPLRDVQPVDILHLRVDDSSQTDHYKVVVAGTVYGRGTDNAFVKTQEYSSTTGEWECAANCPGFGLFQCQNGVYSTDSERKLLLCAGISDVKLGTKGIIIYDVKKKQWEKGPIIPLARPRESPKFDNYSTIQILECGGSIFVHSEQEFGPDVYSCVHRLNMKGTDTSKWKEIVNWKKPREGGLEWYPEFSSVTPIRDKFPESLLDATVLVKSGYMFNLQEEPGEDAFIYIYKFKPNPDGSGDWEVVWRGKWTRSRGPNWTAAGINAFLQVKEEGLGMVVGTDWAYISRGLEEGHGFLRGSKACEDLWGTLLKLHTSITNDLRLQNILPDTSAWEEFWNLDIRGKKKRRLSLENYERMNTILGVKPRKKAGGNKQQIVESSSAGPSLPSQLDHNPVPSTPVGDLNSAVATLCNVFSGGNPNATNEKIVNRKKEALKLVKIGLDILSQEVEKEAQAAKAEKEAPAPTSRRSKASTTGRPRKARRMHA